MNNLYSRVIWKVERGLRKKITVEGQVIVLHKFTCTAESTVLINLVSSVCTNVSAEGFDFDLCGAFTGPCSHSASRLAHLLWQETLGGREGGG